MARHAAACRSGATVTVTATDIVIVASVAVPTVNPRAPGKRSPFIAADTSPS